MNSKQTYRQCSWFLVQKIKERARISYVSLFSNEEKANFKDEMSYFTSRVDCTR